MKKNINILLISALFATVVGCSHADDRRGPPGGERPDFSSVDTDDSGYIDMDEFSEQTLPGNADHQTVFDSIDADGDGQITEQEFNDHKPPAPPQRQ